MHASYHCGVVENDIVQVAYRKPLPVITDLNKPFFDGALSGELRLQRCEPRGHFRFPASSYCPTCLSPEYAWVTVSGRGRLWSWIVMHRSYFPAFKDDVPYIVAYVRLDEGPSLITSLVDVEHDEVQCDLPVEVTFEQVTDQVALPKFRLGPGREVGKLHDSSLHMHAGTAVLPLSGLRVFELGRHARRSVLREAHSRVWRPGHQSGASRRRSLSAHRPVRERPHGAEDSLLFAYLNTGKLGVTLDIFSATGRALAGQLIGNVDVLLDGLGHGELERAGFPAAVLSGCAPGLILTTVEDFGAGPYEQFRAPELVTLALGGLLNMVGQPDAEPIRLGGHQSQFSTGLSAFTGTLAALFERDRSGIGQRVEVTGQETIAYLAWKASIYYQRTGKVQRRGAEESPWFVAKCADGFVAFTYQDRSWPDLVDILGDARLRAETFATSELRARNREEIKHITEEWTADRLKEDIYHHLQGRGIPVGMVTNVADVRTSPQYIATGFSADDRPSSDRRRRLSRPAWHPGRREAAAAAGTAPRRAQLRGLLSAARSQPRGSGCTA